MSIQPLAVGDLLGTVARGVNQRSHGRVRGLCVELEEPAVVLRGRAATYYTKQLAQHGAMDVLHDRPLINEITVG